MGRRRNCSCCGGDGGPTVTCTSVCQDDKASEEYQVVLSGIANGDVCSDCASRDGTYVLDPITPCTWRYISGSRICGIHSSGLVILLLILPGADPNTTAIAVHLRYWGTYEQTSVFYKDFGSLQDCTSWSNLDVPFLHNTGDPDEDPPWNSPTYYCDGSSATCTVTAL